jgi:hypothetical protein
MSNFKFSSQRVAQRTQAKGLIRRFPSLAEGLRGRAVFCASVGALALLALARLVYPQENDQKLGDVFAQDVSLTSIYAVIANPRQYVNKRITIGGYLLRGHRKGEVFGSREDWANGLTKNGVELVFEIENEDNLATTGWAFVEGVFSLPEGSRFSGRLVVERSNEVPNPQSREIGQRVSRVADFIKLLTDSKKQPLTEDERLELVEILQAITLALKERR